MSTKTKNKKARRDSDSDGDSMFASDSSTSLSVPFSEQDKKRRRLNGNNPDGAKGKNGDTGVPGPAVRNRTVDPALLEQAKLRLSKFAARLFDPNRIKGLVEAPVIIPLNDEFLKAFGKREKRKDEEEFDHAIADEDEDDVGNNDGRKKEAKASTGKSKTSKKKENELSTYKVKIVNLNYLTTEETLRTACLRFGDFSEVAMILDRSVKPNSGMHNSGMAYVTFETEEGAQSCLEGLKSLEGRPLRVSVALARSKKNNGGKVRVVGSLLNNQSTKDISTVCFRCGEVGHMESECPNPRKLKPCCLCGMTDHDFRGCPKKQVCFNCGTPGHTNRECPFGRGLPRRMMCGTCLQFGHHRLQCRMVSAPRYSMPDAICMDCGRKGHFNCKELKWFYGLKGVSCFNCGAQGHSGYDCNRPTLYQCINNPDDALQEIQRAEADSNAEELERERRQQRERARERGGNHKSGSGHRNRRAKSSGPNRRDKRGYR